MIQERQLYRIEWLPFEYPCSKSEYDSSINEREGKCDEIGLDMYNSCRCDEVFEVQWLEIREEDQYSTSEVEIDVISRPDCVFQDRIATMADDRARDRHEHGESWWDDGREKETQSEEREQLQEYTENSQEKNHIKDDSLRKEYTNENDEFDEDDEREYHSESCEFAEYDHPPPDRFREDEIDSTTFDLTSNESSSEEQYDCESRELEERESEV